VPSPQAQELLDELREGLARRMNDEQDPKSVYEEAMAEFPVPEGTELERTDLAGVPALRVTAPGASERVGILYLHGGGFAVGSALSNQDLLARLGHGAGVTAIGIDYPLLPDSRFPEAHDAAVAAYRELIGAGEPPVLSGSSAGGGLALAAAMTLRDAGDPAPPGLLFLSPWFDLTVSAPSLDEAEDGDWLGRETLVLAAETYLDGREDTHPLASPLHGDLSGLPEMLIQVGGSEILLDDAQRAADAARRAGTPAELDVWPGMFHNFQLFGSRLDEGAAALERAGEWVAERLGSGG
jgi:monoterpene epsilon-lactone hydrolase